MAKYVAQTVESARRYSKKSPFYADWTVCATCSGFFQRIREVFI